MSTNVKFESQILCPMDKVASYLFDPINEPNWIPAVRDTVPKTPGSFHVGQKVERKVTFLGQSFAYIYEVSATDSKTFADLETAQHPFPIIVRYRLSPVSNEITTVSLFVSTTVAVGYFFKVGEVLVDWMILRMLKDCHQKLKRILEESI